MGVMPSNKLGDFDPAIAQSLTADQRVEVERVLSLASDDRPGPAGDLRISFYWFFVRILWGREKRSFDRLKQESTQHPAISLKNLPGLMSLSVGYVAFCYMLLVIAAAFITSYFLR